MLLNDNVSMSRLDCLQLDGARDLEITSFMCGWVGRILQERWYSIVTEEDDRKKEEEHVAKALSKWDYPPWTIDRAKQDIVE